MRCCGQSFLNVFPRPGWHKVTHRKKSNHLGKAKDSLIIVEKAEVTTLDVLDKRSLEVAGTHCC